MSRRTPLTLALAAALAACGAQGTTRHDVRLVAKGEGIAISAGELEARIEEQPATIRPAFVALDAKRMLVDNLLKVELLARAGEAAGLADDPDVRYTLKKVLAAKYQQRFLQDLELGKDAVPDADVARYYQTHPDEFHRPLRVHVAHVLVAAAPSGPGRAEKRARAKRLLQAVLAREKKDRSAFSFVAGTSSDDAATKGKGGDLLYQSREELEKTLGAAFAALAFATGDDRTAPELVETAGGFHLVHVYGRAPALDETLDEARPVITRSLLVERKAKAFGELLERLRREAGVTIDDAALAGVTPRGMSVAAATAPAALAPVGASSPAATPAARAAP